MRNILILMVVYSANLKFFSDLNNSGIETRYYWNTYNSRLETARNKAAVCCGYFGSNIIYKDTFKESNKHTIFLPLLLISIQDVKDRYL
jgi:hypothetical protein